jgi:hypothetical protein
VVFGSGANEHVDGAAEVALFEGAIRWFQRHYPGVEFVFCMWNNVEGYTASTGYIAELALRYQIPCIDFARICHLATRHGNRYAFCPRDGHPQAAGHFLWAKQLERAFDAADPIASGVAQLYLPERLHPDTIGWEGEMQTYAWEGEPPHARPSPRIYQGKAILLDDTVVNLWATCKEERVGVRVDGEPNSGSGRKGLARRDVRNSTFALGLLSLGDRHVVEVTGTDARLVAADCKVIVGRQWIGAESPRWTLGTLHPQAFASDWGAPYGSQQVVIPANGSVEIDFPGTDFSVAYVDRPGGGRLRVQVDGRDALDEPTDRPFTTAGGEKRFLENRKGIRHLPYGQHWIRVKAEEGPVALLGLFSYDTRCNRSGERILRGTAYPGETVQFVPPFASRPFVLLTGGLRFTPANLTPGELRLGGTSAGQYEIVGEDRGKAEQ